MWSDKEHFYFDLTYDEKFVPVKTIAGFWALISGVASFKKAKYLEKELNNKNTFNRLHRIPTLAATEKFYNWMGGYWKGSIWAPTNTMVIRGLEKFDLMETAYDIAMNDLNCMADVYKKTGTVWENYAPDSIAPGNDSQKDFVGWSGMAPILYLLEYAIGLKPDAETNSLTWNIRTNAKTGCENFRFNKHTITIIAEKAKSENSYNINLLSDGDFKLIINCHDKTKSYNIHKGEQKLIF
jgi:glycogen debranching enzyme